MNRAFIKYFKIRYQGNPNDGAEYLFDSMIRSDSTSYIWDFLEMTGDTVYTPETFIKAAHIILEMKIE